MNPIADKYQTSLRDKLTMYASLLDYRYNNLCIKTNTESLLAVQVIIDNQDFDLEKVAQVAILDDEHFLVIPNNQNRMSQVCKAFFRAHPQLKQEVVNMEESEYMDQDTKAQLDIQKQLLKDQTGEDMPPIYGLILTTPEVNDDMKDQLDDAVDVLKKQCEVKYQKELLDHKNRMAISMAGASPRDMDQANKGLDDTYDKSWSMVEDMTKSMHNDIIAANKRYLLREEEKRKASPDPLDHLSEHDKQVAFSYNPNAVEE